MYVLFHILHLTFLLKYGILIPEKDWVARRIFGDGFFVSKE